MSPKGEKREKSEKNLSRTHQKNAEQRQSRAREITPERHGSVWKPVLIVTILVGVVGFGVWGGLGFPLASLPGTTSVSTSGTANQTRIIIQNQTQVITQNQTQIVNNTIIEYVTPSSINFSIFCNSDSDVTHLYNINYGNTQTNTDIDSFSYVTLQSSTYYIIPFSVPSGEILQSLNLNIDPGSLGIYLYWAIWNVSMNKQLDGNAVSILNVGAVTYAPTNVIPSGNYYLEIYDASGGTFALDTAPLDSNQLLDDYSNNVLYSSVTPWMQFTYQNIASTLTGVGQQNMTEYTYQFANCSSITPYDYSNSDQFTLVRTDTADPNGLDGNYNNFSIMSDTNEFFELTRLEFTISTQNGQYSFNYPVNNPAYLVCNYNFTVNGDYVIQTNAINIYDYTASNQLMVNFNLCINNVIYSLTISICS